MFVGFHKITIEQMPDNSLTNAKVLIDGEEARCFGYKIEQDANSVPVVELKLHGYGRFDKEAALKFDPIELRELCKHATEEHMRDMVKLWNCFHDANLKLVDTTSLDGAETD